MTRARLAGALAVVVPLGLLTKHPAAPGWARAYAGGALYVVFWILLVLLARPRTRPARVAAAVLAVTCALELLQLWHPPFLDGPRDTFLGHALLGSTFSPWDFPCYAAGALLGLALGRHLTSST